MYIYAKRFEMLPLFIWCRQLAVGHLRMTVLINKDAGCDGACFFLIPDVFLPLLSPLSSTDLPRHLVIYYSIARIASFQTMH